ncbi:MAG TPA: FHA domain-containing protein [Bacteriovoracaceae bacterium]|nr:FHA domain-containing protein [Bacteriovoracaceae bacterium]
MKVITTIFNEEPQEHLLKTDTATIGRSSQCDIVINHESMSRKHCLIEVEDGKIYITDLGSTNGVTIDGQRLKPNEKTFYLNSLPLVIGAATVTIDLTDESSQAPRRPATPVHSAPKESSREKTSTLELETKQIKAPRRPKSSVSKEDKDKKKKEILAVIATAIFLLIAIFLYLNQE